MKQHDVKRLQDLRSPARHPLTTWALQLVGYDGVLPAVVLIAPAVLKAFSGNGVLIEVTAVVLPIVAYLVRAGLGWRNIKNNACAPLFRLVQVIALFIGLLALLLVDAFVILSWSLPANALEEIDYQITALIYGSYLMLMALASALFPLDFRVDRFWVPNPEALRRA